MIKLDVLRALVATGCTAEQLLAVIEADASESENRQRARRERDAQRKRDERGRGEPELLLDSDACPQDSRGQRDEIADGRGQSDRIADPPCSNTPPVSKSSEEPRGSSAARAAHSRPVYTDSVHELWGEGVTILVALGTAERQARSLIGSWLKQTKDDAQQVLGAIQRARDQRPIDPIPWITRAIKPGAKSDAAESRSLVAAARRAADRFRPGDGMGDGDGKPVLRIVQKS